MPKKTSAVPTRVARRGVAFRLAAMAGVPLLFFGLLEIVLRIAGAGYPTGFLLHGKDGKSLVQNNQFGWRFFGPGMARIPFPISIAETKPEHTVRIFVFGESAAFGDPQPRFGLARMLEAMLELRHPGVSFEVVNAAMTGINSHVILPIARDCAKAHGDVWVVYMGNNEVVGPFGAGTVFGAQTPPLPIVRAGLALKRTRTAQALAEMARNLHPSKDPGADDWTGMQLFLDKQVREDDARMDAVRHHFENNLLDLIRAGHDSGAGVVVSTVSVNLKNCGPFASLHRAGMSQADQERFGQKLKDGAAALGRGDLTTASDCFKEAEHTDESFAELRFLQGRLALARNDAADAQRQFSAARDLDALRFRCDSRMNDITRKVAAQTGNGVKLVDAERALAGQSSNGLPGDETFYDHVHLTFAGNYRLASIIAPAIEELLPGPLRSPDKNIAWPSIKACADRLAFTDSDQRAALSDMLARLNDPPFTSQLTHDEEVRNLRNSIAHLAASAPQDASNACRRALEIAPRDPWVYAKLTAALQENGDLKAAAEAARRVVELAPTSSESWAQLGIILAQQQQFADAAAAFGEAFRLDPEDVWALQNLAQARQKLGQYDEAIRDYRRCLIIKPSFGLAWIGLGQTFESMGRKAEADECYKKAFAARVHWGDGLAMLARFCASRGWYDAAATNYQDALARKPADARLHIETGQVYDALNRPEMAAAQYADAARWAPDWGQARFLNGLALGRAGKMDESIGEFSEAVRLMPDLAEARIDLGVALLRARRNSEALAQFEETLRRDPSNSAAQRNAQLARQRIAAGN
jgi:tetratricopeptide (TPR) repeat protein